MSGKSKSRSRVKKAVPPSRVRYEKANPAVTVRVPLELRNESANLKEEHGLSLGDVLRIGLDKAKPDLDEAYQQGMEERNDIARGEYEVTFCCSRCRRRHLSIDNPQAKEVAAKLMYQSGWDSRACR